MAIDTDERPNIEERYLVTAVTSNLKIDLDRASGADIIGAAGMVKNQLGLALMHLRAEWDRTDKPRKKTPAEVGARAAQFRGIKDKEAKKRARTEALVWHAAALRQRAAALSGRSVVLGLLTDWAALHGVDVDLLPPALFHWLSPGCPVCDGHGLHKIPDAPSLGNKSCLHCNGTGTWPRPLGAERIHNHIKSCLGKVPGAVRGKLYG